MKKIRTVNGLIAEAFVTTILYLREVDAVMPDILKVSGYYRDKNSGKYIAFDNKIGDCWTEEFRTKAEALEYIGEGKKEPAVIDDIDFGMIEEQAEENNFEQFDKF